VPTARRLASTAVALVALLMGSGLEASQAQEQTSPPAGRGGAPQQPLRVRVSQKVSDALIAKRVQPQYPPEARGKHIQGTVVLRAEISKEGDVTEVTPVSGDPLLAPAAIEAVRLWKYKPYVLNGQPVAVETQVKVGFELQPN
jgi:periplasmic protein TonB